MHLAASDALAAGTLQLQVGAVSEVVEVTAQGAPVQTESGERSGLLDSKQITELMARGRDVMELLQVLPGVVDDATGSDTLGQFGTPTMQGVRSFYNTLNIDGISGNTARGRTAESPINMDAIAEVKVLSNSYTAESGTAAGGVINLTTKSGTRVFHGGAYYYNRNEWFNANNFFSNRAGSNPDGTMRQPRPRYRYNTVGFNLGGPVYIPKVFNTKKQKLFFFFSMEILPNQRPNSLSNFTVPTALERKGDFSQSFRNATTLYAVKDPLTGLAFPNNQVPANRIDPISSKLLTIFPLPNFFDTRISNFAYNYQIGGVQDLPVKQEILRVDYNRNDKLRMWFRASGFSSENTGRTSPAIQNQWGLADVNYAQTMPQLGTSVTYIFTPTLVNEATFGYNLWTEQQKLTDEGLKAYQRATYGLSIPQNNPSNNPLGLIPAMSFGGITGAATVNYDGRFPMVDDSTALSFSDNLTKIWRSHEFKAGVYIQRVLYNQYHQAGSANFPGSFAFANDTNNPNDAGYAYANAILGNFDTYTESTNRVDYAPITRIYEWYVQDHWRASSRLTFDVGLRFTNAIPQTPNNDNAGNFVPYLYNPAKAPVLFRPARINNTNVIINPVTGQTVLPVYSGLIVPGTGDPLNGIITPTTPGYPRAMVFSDGILVAPRFGMAWDPFGNGKTAVRLGGGFFYNPRADAGTLGNLFFNPPAIYNPVQYYGQVTNVINGTGLRSPSSFSRDIDPHHKTVTSYHANFGVQRQVGWGTIVDVAYVGTFGRHLGEVLNLNDYAYGTNLLPQNANPQNGNPLPDNFFRPYLGYGSIPQQIFEGNSSYHSLQVTVNRRFAKSVNFGVSFTHSKAMAYAEGDSTSTSGTAAGSTNVVAKFLDRKFRNYGLAGYDRPNVLTFHFLWDVPRLSRVLPNRFIKAAFDGWQLSDITSFISGPPLGVTYGTSSTVNFNSGGDDIRPLMVGNPVLPNDQRNIEHWFDKNAYAMTVPITAAQCASGTCPAITILNIGNAATRTFRGPGRNNWNISLFKKFNIHEKFRWEFRAEAYNAFNHTQFSGVDTTLTFNPTTGVNTRASTGNITSARDPRIMQLALRVNF
jgi:hypothetical protein